MSDLMALDTDRAQELRQRMETAADDLDWDASALEAPLAEAATLLGSPLPDIPSGTRRVAQKLREGALDLEQRTRMVLAGGPEMNEGLGALERIREHFTMIESRGEPGRADGLLSRRDLRWAVHSTDAETAAAAGWLLEHDRFFDSVETAKHNDDYMNRIGSGEFAFDPDDRDGLMSRDDIDAFLDKTAARAALMPDAATIDGAGGRPDGFMSRQDLEAFLSDYDLSPEQAAAVRQVLADRAYRNPDGPITAGTVLDVLSFVPVIGDVIDGARAVYYSLHGDYQKAALFALALVPLPGLSSSGVRGAIKAVKHVTEAARKSGTKAASTEAARLAMAGTTANYAVYEGTRLAGDTLASDVDIDETVGYVLDDVLGPRAEDLLQEDIDPQLKALLTQRLEHSLNGRLDSTARNRLSEANTVIARRIAENHAFEQFFRKMRPG